MDLHAVFKVSTGVLIVPLSIAMSHAWVWWSKTTLPMQIITGIVVLPLTGVVYVLSSWWESL